MTALALSLMLAAVPAAEDYFRITVVDADTGRGVPLVELRTTNGILHVTDSNGLVAFHEPGLMGKEVFFSVSSHGYEFPKDGFGFRGKTLHVVPGGSAKLTIKRLNIAERLYRVTGGGIYRDTLLAGLKAPTREPALNGLVFGSDSVVNAFYRGKLYWFWGDTNRPAYPLGNFQVTGATSLLPGAGGLDPEIGVDLTYFVGEKGFVQEMARMPGTGLTWFVAAAALKDKAGRERLLASYVKVEAPMKVYARGLAVFDDQAQKFEHLADVDVKAPAVPAGNCFLRKEDGIEYLYFGHPFPMTRIRATLEDFQKIDEYEAFTCLKEGSRLDNMMLDRDPEGQLRWAWRKRTAPLPQPQEAKLIDAGKIRPDEAHWQLRERRTSKPVVAHAGSVYWNAFRKRWIMIAVQSAGTSFLGEVWYAEADSPVGPWRDAVKVVTHDRYSFYNPKQHPLFDKENGRYIFFEGTYAHTFSGNNNPTPRYDYNQVMYKLDLADPRLAMK